MLTRKKSQNSNDELAIIKAAAWAWYQHNSGSQGQEVIEFDITRNRNKSYKPSRYKLEAMRMVEDEKEEGDSLLDNYEKERIFEQLEYLIESASNSFRREVDERDLNQRKPELAHVKKRKFPKLFKFRHAVICGRKEDVDAGAFVHGSQVPRETCSGS